MAEEPENHTLQLLRLIREDQQKMLNRVEDMDEKIDGLTTRIDGNTLILNFIAGLVSNHEDRITALENRVSQPAE